MPPIWYSSLFHRRDRGDNRPYNAPLSPRHRAPIETAVAIPFLVSVGGVALATVLGEALRPFVELAVIPLLYVTVVLITAAAFGLIPSLLASFTSVLALDFFFLPPLYSLRIARAEDFLGLLFFSFVAVTTSGLASRLREQILLARNREKTMGDLYAFSRRLTGIATLKELLETTAQQVGSMLHLAVVVLIEDDEKLMQRASHPTNAQLDEQELAAIRSTWRNKRRLGREPFSLPAVNWQFIPLLTARGAVGALAVARSPFGSPITPDEQRLLRTLAELAGLAIERLFLADEIEQARLARESERLRTALLTSIAHDLRGPVTAVLGALTGLRDDYERFDPDTRNELIGIAQTETERLERFVSSVLHMTRLEAGALEIKREPVHLADVVASAVRRARRSLGTRDIRIALDPELPMLQLDFVLIEQVVYNLLDNAAKYSPENSTISVRGLRGDAEVVLQIIDEGAGIPSNDLERIFEKFYRVTDGALEQGGTGLGLAVCRGFIEALGGSITASNRTDRSGAILTLRLPTADSQ